MNAEISDAFRVSCQIGDIHADLQDAEKGVRHTRLGLHVMFATTLLQYFIFAIGFYVADVFGLASWLAQHTAEWVAFALFLAMAVLMSVSLAMGKHIFYEHRAIFKYALAPVLVMASLGVFFELFNASSQQQNIAYDHAENSKAFASVAGTTITVGSASDSGQLAYYQGELAKAKRYAATCKRTCNAQAAKVAEYGAKVRSLEASAKEAAANTATATSAAIKAKAETLQGMKDEAHKPVFKFFRDLLGVTIAVAVVLVAGLVSTGFEYAHALMSRVLGEKLSLVAGLRDQLGKLQAAYMGLTGKKYAEGDFAEFEEGAIPRPAPAAEPPKQPFGFVPSATQADNPAPLFKYQWQATPKEGTGLGFVGFVDPNKRPAPPVVDPADLRGSGSFRQPQAQPQKADGLAGKPAAAQLTGKPDKPLTDTSNTGISKGTGNSVKTTVYEAAEQARVGQSVSCPHCGKPFVKANKWHTFCSNPRKPREDGGNCADEYWNAKDPQRLAALRAKRRKR